MSTETPRTQQQHWAEAVAECITDEQEALRIVGFYEDGEWQPEMLADTGEVDTVLLLGTLKEVPPKLYPSMQGHWIEKGAMQAAPQEEAQAA